MKKDLFKPQIKQLQTAPLLKKQDKPYWENMGQELVNNLNRNTTEEHANQDYKAPL